MCRRFIHARAQRSDLAKLFSVDCEKKTFLSEKCAPFSHSGGVLIHVPRCARQTTLGKTVSVREGHTTYIRKVACNFLFFLPPEAICARIKCEHL